MCRELLISTIKKQKGSRVTCPIRMFPSCHPKSAMEVHIDGIGGIIYLSCSRCDRLIQRIKVPKYEVPA